MTITHQLPSYLTSIISIISIVIFIQRPAVPETPFSGAEGIFGAQNCGTRRIFMGHSVLI